MNESSANLLLALLLNTSTAVHSLLALLLNTSTAVRISRTWWFSFLVFFFFEICSFEFSVSGFSLPSRKAAK